MPLTCEPWLTVEGWKENWAIMTDELAGASPEEGAEIEGPFTDTTARMATNISTAAKTTKIPARRDVQTLR